MAKESGGAPTPDLNRLFAQGLLKSDDGGGGGGGGGGGAAQGMEQADGGITAKVALKVFGLDASNTQTGSYLGGEMSAPAQTLNMQSASFASLDTRGIFGINFKQFFEQHFTRDHNSEHMTSGLTHAEVESAPVDTSGSGGGGASDGGGGGGGSESSGSGNYEPDVRQLVHSGNFNFPTTPITAEHVTDGIVAPRSGGSFAESVSRSSGGGDGHGL